MKYLLSINHKFFLIIFGLLFFILPLAINNHFFRVFAGHPPNTVGFYCDGNEVWEDVYYTPDDTWMTDADKHKLKDQCGANQVCIPYPVPAPIYTHNAICQDIDKLAESGTGTKMHVTTDPIKNGTPVQIGIGMDFACFDKVQTSSLRVTDRLLGCKMDPNPTVESNCGCDTKQVSHEESSTDEEGNTTSHTVTETVACGPDDWNKVNPYKDDKRCWKTITCQTNPTSRFDLPLVTDDPNCNNHAPITVIPNGEQIAADLKKCIEGKHNIPSNQQDVDKIIAPTLTDDQQNAYLLCNGTVPRELCNQAELDCAKEQNDKREILTGVDKGRFPALPCVDSNVFILGGVARVLGQLCPKPVVAADGQTACFNDKVNLLAKSMKPEGNFDPAFWDCATADYAATQNGQPTEGLDKLKNISKGMGTDTGFYRKNIPITPTTEQLSQQAKPSTEKWQLDGDQIVGDIDCSSGIYLQSNFPYGSCTTQQQGISPPTTSGSCSTAAKAACFDTLTQDQQACTSKTGHDLDNCNNDAVQKKDKCLSACGG